MNRRASRAEPATRRATDHERQLVWLGVFVAGTLIAAAALPRRLSVEAVIIGSAAGTVTDAVLTIFRGWRHGPSGGLIREPWATVSIRVVVALALLGGLAWLLYVFT